MKKMNDIDITFKGKIKLKDKLLWNKAITTAVNSLPSYEKRLVPKFKIYPTLIMSIADNYDLEDLSTDDTATYLFDAGAWAYCRMLNSQNNHLFISLSIERCYDINEVVPPEFSIFHEIGHFQIQYGKKIDTYSTNKNEVEFMADKYGLYALIRMLYKNPEYKTLSKNEIHISFIKNVRKMIEVYIGDQTLTSTALRGSLTKIRNCIMRLMRWEKLYNYEPSTDKEAASMER